MLCLCERNETETTSCFKTSVYYWSCCLDLLSFLFAGVPSLAHFNGSPASNRYIHTVMSGLLCWCLWSQTLWAYTFYKAVSFRVSPYRLAFHTLRIPKNSMPWLQMQRKSRNAIAKTAILVSANQWRIAPLEAELLSANQSKQFANRLA